VNPLTEAIGAHPGLVNRYPEGMPNVGPWEIILLLLLALLLFGAKRVPEIGRSLGSGMREFKESVTHQSLPETTEHDTTD